jgi:hypothetical protein
MSNSKTNQTSSSSSNSNTNLPAKNNPSSTNTISKLKTNWDLNSNNNTIKCDQDNLCTPQTPIIKIITVVY